MKKVDAHPVQGRERRLAGFLPFLEALEGLLGPGEELEPRRDDEEGQGQAEQAFDEGEPAPPHGVNPRSREMNRTATVSGPARPACRALSLTRFRPSPSSAISQASATRQRPGSTRTVSA